jgi:hypothetical protein
MIVPLRPLVRGGTVVSQHGTALGQIGLRPCRRLARRRTEEATRRQCEYDVAQAQYWAQVQRDAAERGY